MSTELEHKILQPRAQHAADAGFAVWLDHAQWNAILEALRAAPEHDTPAGQGATAVAEVVYSNWNGINIEPIEGATQQFPVGTKLYLAPAHGEREAVTKTGAEYLAGELNGINEGLERAAKWMSDQNIESAESHSAALRALATPAKQPDLVSAPEAKPLSEYHEDFGPVVWWAFPVKEMAWIGSPNDSDWPGYHTHWTPHPSIPALPAAAVPEK